MQLSNLLSVFALTTLFFVAHARAECWRLPNGEIRIADAKAVAPAAGAQRIQCSPQQLAQEEQQKQQAAQQQAQQLAQQRAQQEQQRQQAVQQQAQQRAQQEQQQRQQAAQQQAQQLAQQRAQQEQQRQQAIQQQAQQRAQQEQQQKQQAAQQQAQQLAQQRAQQEQQRQQAVQQQAQQRAQQEQQQKQQAAQQQAQQLAQQRAQQEQQRQQAVQQQAQQRAQQEQQQRQQAAQQQAQQLAQQRAQQEQQRQQAIQQHAQQEQQKQQAAQQQAQQLAQQRVQQERQRQQMIQPQEQLQNQKPTQQAQFAGDRLTGGASATNGGIASDSKFRANGIGSTPQLPMGQLEKSPLAKSSLPISQNSPVFGANTSSIGSPSGVSGAGKAFGGDAGVALPPLSPNRKLETLPPAQSPAVSLNSATSDIFKTSSIHAPLKVLRPVFHLADPEYSKLSKNEKIEDVREHTGVDYRAAKDTPVYAVCDGTVKHNATNVGDVMQAILIVLHTCEPPLGNVYAYYGHVKVDLKVGAKVVAGDILGVVRDWPGNSHLHMGFNTKLKTVGWGRAPRGTSKQQMQLDGWLDPENYLR